MPAQILGAIPKSGFEIAIDQIGAILLVEIANQKTIQGSALPEALNIWKERLIPYDSADQVLINVHLASAEYGTMTQQDAMGRTLFNIDVDVSGTDVSAKPGVPAVPGGLDAMNRLHKYLAIIGYIFRTPYYRMLGYPAGTFGGTYVEQLLIQEPVLKEDTDYTAFGRIVLAVRIHEGTEVPQGVPLQINNTQVFLDLTEKGFKFVFNNP